MSTGFGNLHTSPKRRNTGGGPPFVGGSAYNGLSIDTITGQIVLGQDVGAVGNPAQLISNREIPLNAFSIQLTDANFLAILQTGFFALQDFANVNAITLSTGVPATIVISDFSADFPTLSLSNSLFTFDVAVDSFAFKIRDNATTDEYFLLNPTTGIFSLGDLSGTGNGTKIDVKDASTSIQMSAGTTGMQLILAGAAGSELFEFVSASGNRYFFNDVNVLDFRWGDVDLTNNGTRITIDDTTQIIRARNGTAFIGLELDFANADYQMGDVPGLGNSTKMVIDDNGQFVEFFCSVFGVNMVPVVSPFGVSSLPAFANNAAAVVGGLSIGEFYRISVAGTSTVAVVE